MPAVSKAQFKKMIELYKKKEITREELERFMDVDYKKLPKRKRKKK